MCGFKDLPDLCDGTGLQWNPNIAYELPRHLTNCRYAVCLIFPVQQRNVEIVPSSRIGHLESQQLFNLLCACGVAIAVIIMLLVTHLVEFNSLHDISALVLPLLGLAAP